MIPMNHLPPRCVIETRIREIDEELGRQDVVPLAPSYIAELNERRARFQEKLDVVIAYYRDNPGTPAFMATLSATTGRFEVRAVSRIRLFPDGTVLVRFAESGLELAARPEDVFETEAGAQAHAPVLERELNAYLASVDTDAAGHS